MKFDLKHFWAFCNQLKIDSKEKGQTRLSSPLGTQRYFVEQIVRGLEEDKHFFVALKGRQQGITTIMLALDLYWHWRHPGMQGTLIADNDQNKDGFRTTLQMYQSGLPSTHRVTMMQDNRTQMVWKNRSRVFFQTAGGKTKGGGGRGKGIIFLHGTETGFWNDDETLKSILSSLAEKNPARLHVFESTAHGDNMFKDMYDDACNAVTQAGIFIGWWRNELYHVHQDSSEYKAYWDGRLTPNERDWHRAVKLKYRVDINSRQIAWYRWFMAEKMGDDEKMMLQEHPWLDDQAFQLSGSNFFTLSKLAELRKGVELEDEPEWFAFRFAEKFADAAIIPTVQRNACLAIWEQPQPDGFYVVGADPAYGSSSWKDQFCVQVYRCYADKIEQVAEFCTTECRPDQFAWVICYLCGIYGNCIMNLEQNGPGAQVQQELITLQRIAATIPATNDEPSVYNFLSGMRAYLYKRLDSFGVGIGAIGWITTERTKERMMNALRDLTEREEMIHHSLELLDEARSIVRDDGIIASPGRKKDDRVIAAALAVMPYVGTMKLKLMQMGETKEAGSKRKQQREDRGTPQSGAENMLERTVRSHLQRLGINR